MYKDIENHIKTCERCLRLKAQSHKVELHPNLITNSMELVLIDNLTIDSGKSKILTFL